VAETLALSAWRDGAFFGASPAIGFDLLLLGIDGFFGWQKSPAAQSWHGLAGSPLAITVSPDGHDAAAHHLMVGGDACPIEAAHWHTATSLGNWSLVAIERPETMQLEDNQLAAPDWFPTPRAGGQ